MRVLFLCEANVTRSQMAEAFFNKYSKKHTSQSAALKIDINYIEERVIRAMKEIGSDLSNKKPKPVTNEMIDNADKVIIMSPDLKEYYHWDKKPLIWDVYDVIKDKNGYISYQQFVDIRNKIDRKIKGLVKRLG